MHYVYLSHNVTVVDLGFCLENREELFRCVRCSNDPEWVAYHRNTDERAHQSHEAIRREIAEALGEGGFGGP